MPKKTATTKVTPTNLATPVAATVFGESTKKQLSGLAEMIIALQHNQRRTIASTKNRGEVQGSTKKPWRQKGTGRARVGNKRNPLWRGGGNTFGPQANRNFSTKINQRLRQPALITSLITKAQAGEIWQLNETYTGNSKTKDGLKFLLGQLDPKSNLIIMTTVTPEFKLATRNIKYITVRAVRQINALDIVSHRRVIFVGDTINQFMSPAK